MNDGNGEFVLSGLYDDLLDEEQEPWTGPSQSAILSTTAADGSITTRRRESLLEDFGEEQEQGSGSNQDLTSTMTTRGLGDLRNDIRNISSRHSDHATDLRDDIRDMTSGSRYTRNDLQNDTSGITSFSRRLSNIRDGLRVLATSEPRISLSPSSDREHDLRDEFRNMVSETRQSSWDLRNDIRLAQIGSHRDLRVDIERHEFRTFVVVGLLGSSWPLAHYRGPCLDKPVACQDQVTVRSTIVVAIWDPFGTAKARQLPSRLLEQSTPVHLAVKATVPSQLWQSVESKVKKSIPGTIPFKRGR
ncbi:hypothetical protein BGZ99_000646 [Dissophora globulifera]|uniref:Uncharacterized protein n=1 Tax=Dissophora globulifera TaxID=979702 RepID=A0A9P6R4N0_9FUNG|nr:hypothetical protein BGZ99_000646 [Dissophora globulifera]